MILITWMVFINIFWGSHPENPLQGWNFPCPIDSIFGFWLPKLRLRCISYVDFHLFEWKENEQIPQKNPTFAPKICQSSVQLFVFFEIFCSPKKNNGRKCMVRIRRKKNKLCQRQELENPMNVHRWRKLEGSIDTGKPVWGRRCQMVKVNCGC